MSMRQKTCCFTGHRSIPQKLLPPLTELLEQEILTLYNQGIHYFGAGGALGFDTLAAEAVLRLRKNCPLMRLILVLPCPDQTKGWRPQDMKRYEEIKAQADKIVYTSTHYTSDCMQKRNRHLVDHSCICVCYLVRTNGGSAYTICYAGIQGVEVRNLHCKMPAFSEL